MTDVFALADGMATTIFERAKQVILSADCEFRRPASIAYPNLAPGGSRSADMPLSWHQRRTAETVRSVPLCAAGAVSNACFPFAAHSSRACSP